MRRVGAGVASALIATAIATVAAHDFFLHPRGFLVAPDATITIPVFTGTFTTSENAVERSRIEDLSSWGPAGREALPRSSWTDNDPRSTVRLRVGRQPGTYAVGVELTPRTIALDGATFDAYLAEEHIDAVLAHRKAAGRLGRPARESYAKAAKTLLAVTDASGHRVPPPAGAPPSPAGQAFGHAAEIVATIDPYTLDVGGALPVRCLIGGRPLAGWTIVAGGTIGTSGEPIPEQALTTDRDGRATVRLTHDGHWFVRFVHMREATPGEGVDYVSRWATLTFGVQPAGSR